MNNNYYQSDIRTSRQEDILLSIDDDRQRLLGLIKYWREECFKQDKQLKAYENMRKEAIEYVKEFTFEPLLINEDRKLIMYNENLKNFENILNKVGEDNE